MDLSENGGGISVITEYFVIVASPEWIISTVDVRVEVNSHLEGGHLHDKRVSLGSNSLRRGNRNGSSMFYTGDVNNKDSVIAWQLCLTACFTHNCHDALDNIKCKVPTQLHTRLL